jgi:hypothetical protein
MTGQLVDNQGVTEMFSISECHTNEIQQSLFKTSSQESILEMDHV